MIRDRILLAFIIIGISLVAIYLILQAGNNDQLTEVVELESRPAPSATPFINPSPTATRTPQPIFPSRTPASQSEAEPSPRPASTQIIPTETVLLETFPTTSLEDLPEAPPTAQPESACPVQNCLARFGMSGSGFVINRAYEVGLPVGAYLSWSIEPVATGPPGAVFWQLVNVSENGPVPSWEQIAQVVAARPGSIWIIGNEPDVKWQNNTRPEQYAEVYHDLYTFIKDRDASSRIAIAGIAQPTPLRLRYLDIVLNSYHEKFGQAMPIDIWTVHGFILQELRGSWGVDIPPGIEDNQGITYSLQDHNNIEIFRQNLINFRAWMAQRGYQDRPLALTEYGILHPSDYGFPPDVVATFMVEALDFLVNAANETGYPSDGGRLFQWWFWFSAYEGGDFPTGNLYDPKSNQLTSLGHVYTSYVRALVGNSP